MFVSAVFGDATPEDTGVAAAEAADSATYTNGLKCVVPNVTKPSETTVLHYSSFPLLK